MQRDREGNNYGHFKINLKHHLLPILVKIDYPLIIFYGFSNFVTLLLIIFQYFSLAQIIAISVHIYVLVQAEVFCPATSNEPAQMPTALLPRSLDLELHRGSRTRAPVLRFRLALRTIMSAICP